MSLPFFRRCLIVLLNVAFAASLVGCGADSSTSVSAPPPEMTPEQHAADIKRQTDHYAAPSEADRRKASN